MRPSEPNGHTGQSLPSTSSTPSSRTMISSPSTGTTTTAPSESIPAQNDLIAAGGAVPIREVTTAAYVALGDQLQDDLSIRNLVEAGLADVVLGLRRDWITGLGKYWSGICAIDMAAGTELEKRIATALRYGFFHYAQLLCGLEVLLLQLEELGVVREQTVLGLEELFVHPTDDVRELVCIAESNGGLPDVLGDADGGRNTA
ncbi:hypothetical protein LMG26411_00145 [Cupriavidus numazuensis]|uniref:Uncharacterized protein n=1 Tax=Cupriavidus numazuensis TaxID=221992 RepID=A0ABM8T9I8_9BURK|nr:hypothetical protein LMG26411_00145 [Cupriavidus numazuensis]